MSSYVRVVSQEGETPPIVSRLPFVGENTQQDCLFDGNELQFIMTEIIEDQMPPIIHGPSDKEKKYDRQLRLWAANGQQALEDAHICLVNSGSGTVGVETLKNLVLPGTSYFPTGTCIVNYRLTPVCRHRSIHNHRRQTGSGIRLRSQFLSGRNMPGQIEGRVLQKPSTRA